MTSSEESIDWSLSCARKLLLDLSICVEQSSFYLDSTEGSKCESEIHDDQNSPTLGDFRKVYKRLGVPTNPSASSIRFLYTEEEQVTVPDVKLDLLKDN